MPPMVSQSRRAFRTLAVFSAAMVVGSVSVSASAGQLPGQLSVKPLAQPQGATPQRTELPSLSLDAPATPRLPLLNAFRNAEVERPGPARLYQNGPWGQPRLWYQLALGDAPPVDASVAAMPMLGEDEPVTGSWSWFVQLTEEEPPALVGPTVDEPEGEQPSWWTAIWSLSQSASDPWADSGWSADALARNDAPATGAPSLLGMLAPQRFCRRRPVKFVRYGAETDSFPLVRCDGSVAPEALDRLTLMARPPEVPRPGALLPDEPDPEAWARGEWLDQVRPVHPRLLWLLQRVADAYPWRMIYVFSGYRPKKSASNHSFHGEARAMDISVSGVRNEDLFRFCRTLDDAGCGYYPNSKFVHIDARRPATGRAFWVDASGPGEPSRYVDSWPGVVESGAMVWNPDPY